MGPETTWAGDFWSKSVYLKLQTYESNFMLMTCLVIVLGFKTFFLGGGGGGVGGGGRG